MIVMWYYCDRAVITLCTVDKLCYRNVVIVLWPYFNCTVIILWSYCDVLLSYCNVIVIILWAYCDYCDGNVSLWLYGNHTVNYDYNITILCSSCDHNFIVLFVFLLSRCHTIFIVIRAYCDCIVIVLVLQYDYSVI